MKIYHLSTGLLDVNSYFLVNEQTSKAVLIDGGENYKQIKKTIEELNIDLVALFLTHGHFDHAGNAKALQDDGVKVYIGKLDAPKLSNSQNLASDFGRKFEKLTPDFTFDNGDVITVEDIKLEVIMTPGHTDGSATFKVDNMLFTGDTLFLQSIGRTDFPTGDKQTLINSVKRLFALQGDYNVYPGHQEFTTLSHEREFNTFIDYD